MLLIPLLALFFAAIEIPTGAELHVRLTGKISSKDSKPGEAVAAVVTVPVLVGAKVAIQRGTTLHGTVKSATPYASPEKKAAISVEFSELRDAMGASAKVAVRVKEVENARESVQEDGGINGIDPSQTISARLDQGLGKLGGSFGQILATAKASILKPPDPEIVYDPGTEMIVVLTGPVTWEGKAYGPRAGSFPNNNEISRLAAAQPFRTVAGNPPKPSDITNLMFIGSIDELKAAFQEAGWQEAAALSGTSKYETFRSIAEARGYKEAPMSVLLLENNKPDLDAEKQLNTFAMRHHLRVWRRPGTYKGKQVWVCAATHDTGIEPSPEQRTFIHKIDSNIDLERAKVANDLIFTGKVKSFTLVDRPAVPKEAMNATGDKLITDGKMAVLMF
jgi:hypothetical protein